MLRLGMAQRASEDLPSLEAIADDRRSPALAVDALLSILQIDSMTAPESRRVATFERVRSFVESDRGGAFGTGFKARAQLALAEARLRANDPAGAESWIRKALELQRREDGSVPRTKLASFAITLEGVSLLQRGRGRDALQSLSAARRDISELFGPNDPSTCIVSLNVAIALDAVGRTRDALEMVDHAEPILRKVMGAEAPTYLRVKDLKDRLDRKIASESLAQKGNGLLDSGVRTRSHLPIDFFS